MRRWEELRPEFDKRGVAILTVSTDTPKELAKGHRRHGIGATMLSDRQLDVTDRFGLRNKGIHSGPPPPVGAKALPVPTSILADASGTVLWMDQSENYQRRSDPDYVLAALRDHLD
ncbi:MAG: redoxin domain-containing protein [Deltaproteobacteria bacterium]|nr:redoxin domain-containing protein [Deltaproteobacteria bacterium]